MSNQFPHLFTPGKIGNVEIKNRICKAPQTSGLSHMARFRSAWSATMRTWPRAR